MPTKELKRKYNSNEVIVNNKSNFKSHLVRCQAIMDNTHFDRLVIKGMGRATSRAVNLALQLNANNYNTFEIETKTYSVGVLDEKKTRTPIVGANRDSFDPGNVDLGSTKVERQIPALEIVVRKNKLELAALGGIEKKGAALDVHHR